MTEKPQVKVLIVDDDGQIARMLDMALRSWKYDTVQAKNLAEAAKLLDISRDQLRYRLKKDESEKSKALSAKK